MTPDYVLALLGFVTSCLLGLLVWVGTRVQAQVDRIPEELAKMRESVDVLGRALTIDLQHHEVRINTLETKMDLYYPHKRRVGDIMDEAA